jgi:hypothetical protein
MAEQPPQPPGQQPPYPGQQPPYPPDPYAADRQSRDGGGNGWLIALGVVAVLILGVLTAAIISKGDEGTRDVTVTTNATTVQQKNTTTTVTTPAPNITIQPDVTLSQDGTPKPTQSNGTTGTGETNTGTTSP